MKETNPKKIEALKDILLRLHHGASPESVQEDFNKNFTGVSAIEISLMEHELMNEDSGITFEDVMKLCNVHANLFKGSIDELEIAEADKPGHPVRVLKDENIAFRTSMIRIRRLLDSLKETPEHDWDEGLLKGLERQVALLGEFKKHYARKEEVMFPIMERYGHDAPPKVMWAVDDDIRDLFDLALESVKALPYKKIDQVIADYDAFEFEFKEMIFKEEAILINIMLEIFSEEDWLSVATESDTYGYAIVRPSEKWVPVVKDVVSQASNESMDFNASKKENSSLPQKEEALPAESNENFQINMENNQVSSIDISQNLANLAKAAIDLSQSLAHLSLSPSEAGNETRKNTKSLTPSSNQIDQRIDEGPQALSDSDSAPQILDVRDEVDQNAVIKFDTGYLSLKELNLMMEHLQLEITFVGKDDIFTYYNDQVDVERKILPRTPSAIGRHIDKCHPPRLVPKIQRIVENLRTKKTDRETMWFSREGFFALILYRGVYDENGEFMGILETVQNIEPLFDLADVADNRWSSVDLKEGITDEIRGKPENYPTELVDKLNQYKE